MGTYLQPCCKDPVVLEQLIDVPSGTYERVQKLEAAEHAVTDPKHFKPSGDEQHNDSVTYLFHQIKNSDSNLRKMSDFLSSGWGKFDLSLIQVVKDGDDVIGGIDPGIEAQNMLISSSSYISYSGHLAPKQVVELSEGLYWA
jgi:hypothetical protein